MKPSTDNNVPADGQWTTGVWDCREDGSNCLFTCLCPCVTFGRIAEIVDRGATPHPVGCTIYWCLGATHGQWLYGGLFRTKLRRLFSLPEAPHSDYCLHGCCCIFALSQEYRELKNRGVDPSIGWEANVAKWKRDGLKPPIVEEGMTRY